MAVLIEQQDYCWAGLHERRVQVTGISTVIGAKLAGSCLGALLMTWLPAAGGRADRRVHGLP